MSNTPVSRAWQEKALSAIRGKWRSDNPNQPVLIAACPGAGKTLLAVTASVEMLKDGLIDLVIVIVPTVNIKVQWKEQFKRFNISAISDVTNENMRFRKINGERLVGNYLVICVTYAQLSKDKELFEELTHSDRTLLIADEVHHSDDEESFGIAVDFVASNVAYKLALSGTPFNSSGGSLAMCPWKEEATDEGRIVRKSLPTWSYDYGQAISEDVCRPVEFVAICGKGEQTYRRLSNQEVWKKVINLADANKNTPLSALLNGDGDFLESLIIEGLKSLSIVKRHDKHAGMLIVAKDKDHGSKIAELIASLCGKNSEWIHYQFVEIYHDTPNAHEKIRSLENDHTDIIITVRMISEGVDVRRLRVGVFATDYRTRMFFIQFIGRFVRWETRLDATQYGRIIIPAHIMLLEYAREIERMINEAEIKKIDEGDTGDPPVKNNELIGSTSEKTDDSIIYRGKESKERALAEAFFRLHPSLNFLPEYLAITAAKEANLDGSCVTDAPEVELDWWKKNSKLVASIVRKMKVNGEDDGVYYAKVNKAANKHVGIKRVDKLIPIEIMKQRAEYLRQRLVIIHNGGKFDDDV